MKKLATIITPLEQKRLYTYNLLDALSTVSGIGKQRLQNLQDKFESDYPGQQVPPDINWIYRFALDLIKQPLNAEQLCTPREDHPSILDSFAYLSSTELYAVNEILNSALSPIEKTVMFQLYRGRIPVEQIARQLGRSKQGVYEVKSRALKKLRQPQYLKALTGIVFARNSFN